VFNLSKAQKRSFLLSDNRIGLDARLAAAKALGLASMPVV
jgi:hypothetical protein